MGITGVHGVHGVVDGAIQTVAMYVRVSTEEQARSGLGIQAQRDRCRGMAMAKGWPEPIEYADEGKSGTIDNLKRDGMRALLHDIETGHIGAVIVNDISRIARRSRLVLEAVEMMGKRNVMFVSCKESFDTTTAQGQFVLQIFAALAELERAQIAERTSAALTVLSQRTGYTGGRLPYGYAMAPDTRVVVDVEAAAIVRRIFLLHRRGFSLRAIAAWLNARDCLPPRGGEKWQHTSVAVILSQADAYAGGTRGQSELRWPVIYRQKGEAISE